MTALLSYTILSKSQLTKREYKRFGFQIRLTVYERDDYHREEWSLVPSRFPGKLLSPQEANTQINSALATGWTRIK